MCANPYRHSSLGVLKAVDPTLTIPVDRIDWMQELFVKAGVVPTAVPTSTLIDTSVRDDAAKLAGQ